jgi:hypothetical protein
VRRGEDELLVFEVETRAHARLIERFAEGRGTPLDDVHE